MEKINLETKDLFEQERLDALLNIIGSKDLKSVRQLLILCASQTNSKRIEKVLKIIDNKINKMMEKIDATTSKMDIGDIIIAYIAGFLVVVTAWSITLEQREDIIEHNHLCEMQEIEKKEVRDKLIELGMEDVVWDSHDMMDGECYKRYPAFKYDKLSELNEEDLYALYIMFGHLYMDDFSRKINGTYFNDYLRKNGYVNHINEADFDVWLKEQEEIKLKENEDKLTKYLFYKPFDK